jgi:hypothetical protein
MKKLFLFTILASLLVPVSGRAQLLENRLRLNSLTLFAGSGAKALQLQTGAFLDLGGGASDYLYSDGSYIYTPTLFGASTFFATVATPGFVSLYGANGTKFCPGADTACFTSDGTTISAPALEAPSFTATAASGAHAVEINTGSYACFDGSTCSAFLRWTGIEFDMGNDSLHTSGVFHPGYLKADIYVSAGIANTSLYLRGDETSDGTAIAAKIGNNGALTTTGDKILGLYSDAITTRVGDFDIKGTYSMDGTDASGTPGAATINQPVGQVAVAASASSVVVTNSLVTAASIVLPTLQFVDATCTQILSCVPAAGSFTITMNAACTANTKVGFLLHNYF